MTNWTYSQITQQENALREAGCSLFSSYEWHKREENAEFVSLRFTSADQATSYAYQKLEKGQLR